MGILDKFLSIMKLDDEEDYEDDDLFGEDDFEEPKKKNRFKTDKIDEDDYSDEDFEKPKKPTGATRSNKVKPTAVDEAREITETLLGNRTVILNLEGLDIEIAQRIIDFTSGATFAINGNLQKISNYIFLVTPNNVDISGDLTDLLSTSFDVPSIKTRY